MSNPSIGQLLAWMKDKSRTYGWGALIAYDRRKTNELLQQLYIERFNSDSYLPLIDQTLPSSDYAKEHVSGLKLSVPRLSFETADLRASRVTLTMDFVGGLIVTEAEGRGIARIQKVLPLNSPQLSMIQPLDRVPGEVAGDGVVSIDIANEEGTEYKATFVMGDLDQHKIGGLFKLYFQEELDDEQKRFPLGTLAAVDNGALTPEGFEIRTMAAPGARVRGAENFGDGAVLVMARMKGQTNGNTPGDEFLYPIPADAGGKAYTGTVWVSSRALFHDLIKPDIESDIGNGLDFGPYQGSSDVADQLQAIAGGLCHADLTVSREMGIDESASLTADFNYLFSDVAGPLTLSTKDDTLTMSWNTRFSTDYDYKMINKDWFDDEKEGTLACSSSAGITLRPRLDELGVVHFEKTDAGYSLAFKADQELEGFTHVDHTGNPYLSGVLEDQVWYGFYKMLSNVTVPSVDTFLVRNLLFPGHNALQPSDVHVPGDLALFGHIDPARTSVAITPLRPTIEAGGSQAFTLQPGPAGVTWSVRGTDPDDTDVGSISSAGVYKAPAAGSLVKGYLSVVITAKGKLDGKDVTVSAMLDVLTSTVAVNPVYQVCNAGQSVELSAQAMSTGDPVWSLKEPGLDGKLSTSKGRSCTYTAGPMSGERPAVYIDTVLAGNPDSQARSEAMVLVYNSPGGLEVVISEASNPSSGKVQLQIVVDGMPANPDEWGVECQLLAGSGTLSASGLYEQAKDANGFAAIAMTFDDGIERMAGFIALPLPLERYDEINRRVSASIRNRLVHKQDAKGE